MADIRLLDAGDLDALAEFFERVSSDEQTARFFQPFPLTADQARAIVEAAESGPNLFAGAFEADRIVGFAMLRGFDEGYPSPAFGLCVDPGARGRGIGGALVEWAASEAARIGAPAVVLKVSDDNVDARRLYESHGFEFTGERAANGELWGRRPLGYNL